LRRLHSSLKCFRTLSVILVLLLSACGQSGAQKANDSSIPSNLTLVRAPSSTPEPIRRSLPTVLGFTDEHIEELETDRYQVAHVTETTVDDKRYVAYVFGESPESFSGRMVLIYRFENDEPVLVLHSLPGEAPSLPSISGAFDARTEDWNDLNRDGQPDLLIYYNMLGTGSGGVDQVYLVQVDHNGELVELTEPIYNDFHLAPYVIEDIDQDGILELIVGDYRGEWYGSSHADGVASFQIYAWESDGSVSDVSANFAEMYEEDITRTTTIVRDSYSKSLSKRDMVNVMAQAFGLLMAYENSGRRDEGWQIYWELTNPENWPQASSESLEIINERRGQHRTQYEAGQRFVPYQLMGTLLGLGVSGELRQDAKDVCAHWLPIVQAQRDGTLDLDSVSQGDQDFLCHFNVPVMLAWVRAMIDWPAIEPADFRCPIL
jgi:hypothetical protein